VDGPAADHGARRRRAPHRRADAARRRGRRQAVRGGQAPPRPREPRLRAVSVATAGVGGSGARRAHDGADEPEHREDDPEEEQPAVPLSQRDHAERDQQRQIDESEPVPHAVPPPSVDLDRSPLGSCPEQAGASSVPGDYRWKYLRRPQARNAASVLAFVATWKLKPFGLVESKYETACT